MQGAWWFETNQVILLSDYVLFSKRFNLGLLEAKFQKDCVGVMTQCRGCGRWWNAMTVSFEAQGRQMDHSCRLR